MKKTLLILLTLLVGLGAQAKEWQWGTASWNIADGTTFESIDDFNNKGGVVLTFTNPNKYTLTFTHIIAVNYNIYVDDATEPIEATASAQQSTEVNIDYRFAEGHTYKLVTTKERLCQANMATYSTDTLSTAEKVFTITFTINGPEAVKTIDVEGTMALTIVDQTYFETYSPIDVKSICEALGITNISEAEVYGLNPNGSYNPYFRSDCDGWRDVDGEYTTYYGYDNAFIREKLGHKPTPAVYCIKLNESADTIFYYFYDTWEEYDPDKPTEVPVSGGGAKRRASATSYNSVVWDWEWVDEEGNPQVTKYTRNYRCDEGKDYKAGFILKANNKAAYINATLHFVSQEAFEEYIATDIKATPSATKQAANGIYSLNGTRQQTLRKGFNIIREGDKVKKVFVR